MSLFQLIMAGGITIYILLACSVVSIALIIERCLFYRKLSRVSRAQLMASIKNEVEKKGGGRALEICKEGNAPFANVVHAGLLLLGNNREAVSNAMDRQIVVETTKLEQFIGIVGSIGSNAVYIGLFGTVLGIIRAFHNISVSGSGELNVIIGGISEALVCTAAGLLVAVPAVVAYNFFLMRIDIFTRDMELSASEVMDIVRR